MIFALNGIFQTVSLVADWLVESMDGISTTISKEWVGLILLPMVSSIAGSSPLFQTVLQVFFRGLMIGIRMFDRCQCLGQRPNGTQVRFTYILNASNASDLLQLSSISVAVGSTIVSSFLSVPNLPYISINTSLFTANCSVCHSVSRPPNLDYSTWKADQLRRFSFMVTLAWAMGKPLALLFDPFESLVSPQ